jgi:hypothetical protein
MRGPHFMTACFLGVILLLGPSESFGQRGIHRSGSPPKPTQLLLQLRVNGKRFYFRISDLKKMQRSVVVLTDRPTGVAHRYEGVDLEKLILNRTEHRESEVIEIFTNAHQTITIPSADLDTNAQPMVVDTVDGKALAGYVPYYFIAKTRQGNSQPMKGVKKIDILSAN